MKTIKNSITYTHKLNTSLLPARCEPYIIIIIVLIFASFYLLKWGRIRKTTHYFRRQAEIISEMRRNTLKGLKRSYPRVPI